MLILARKRDEDLVILTPEGRKIVVCVVDQIGRKVRLGITADPEVIVHRGEVYLAQQRAAKAEGAAS